MRVLCSIGALVVVGRFRLRLVSECRSEGEREEIADNIRGVVLRRTIWL